MSNGGGNLTDEWKSQMNSCPLSWRYVSGLRTPTYWLTLVNLALCVLVSLSIAE